MTIRTAGIPVRFFAVLLCCFALSGCGQPASSPEQAVRDWLEQGQLLAEDKDRNGLMDLISSAYADARGNTRDDIENMLRVYFLRQHSIELLVNVGDVVVYGDSAAKVDVTVGMAGTNDGVLGFSARAYNFELELERDGDDWLLLAARWGEVGGEIH